VWVSVYSALCAAAAGCAREAPRSAQIWIAGDLHVGEGPADVLEPIAELTGRSPLFLNLEGPVARAPTSGSKGHATLRLSNHPDALPSLFAAGVRVAGIANNHAGDAGSDGPARTAGALERAGIAPASAKAATYDLDGVHLAVTAHDLTGGVPPSLAADLWRARAGADVLVATFHVTGPPLYLPRPELRRAAEVALAAGASVVAAHGTHALGPVERRGDAVIAWGLGNLAFACRCTKEREGLLLLLELDGRRVARAAVVPVEAGLHGRRAQPSPTPQATFDLLEALGSTPLRRGEERAWF
jgi:poly-gamma-glutamate synthesis protein (capsule biosynthesis protein)